MRSVLVTLYFGMLYCQISVVVNYICFYKKLFFTCRLCIQRCRGMDMTLFKCQVSCTQFHVQMTKILKKKKNINQKRRKKYLKDIGLELNFDNI